MRSEEMKIESMIRRKYQIEMVGFEAAKKWRGFDSAETSRGFEAVQNHKNNLNKQNKQKHE